LAVDRTGDLVASLVHAQWRAFAALWHGDHLAGNVLKAPSRSAHRAARAFHPVGDLAIAHKLGFGQIHQFHVLQVLAQLPHAAHRVADVALLLLAWIFFLALLVVSTEWKLVGVVYA